MPNTPESKASGPRYDPPSPEIIIQGSPPGVGLSAETCRRGCVTSLEYFLIPNFEPLHCWIYLSIFSAMEDTDAQQDHSSLRTPCNPLDASKASSDALPGQSANEDSINVPNHQHPTTPPRPTAPACSSNKPDTPAVCSDSFRTGSLSEREDAVLADIRCLRCMSVDEFIAIFLPTLPDDIDIEHVLTALANNPQGALDSFNQNSTGKEGSRSES